MPFYEAHVNHLEAVSVEIENRKLVVFVLDGQPHIVPAQFFHLIFKVSTKPPPRADVQGSYYPDAEILELARKTGTPEPPWPQPEGRRVDMTGKPKPKGNK